MARWTRSRLSFANVMSIIAVFVALGGTGYAAATLPKNSVGTRQIKSNAVTSAKVKNGSLKSADFKQTDLPKGQTGAQGAQGLKGDKGDKGDQGTADAFARVQPNGTLLPAIGDFPATAKNLADGNITHPVAGTYCFVGMPFRPASAVVSSDNAAAAAATQNNVVVSVAVERGNGLNGCPADANARVVATQWTDAAAPTNVDKGFVIWFEQG
jgi:hypothetical protein